MVNVVVRAGFSVDVVVGRFGVVVVVGVVSLVVSLIAVEIVVVVVVVLLLVVVVVVGGGEVKVPTRVLAWFAVCMTAITIAATAAMPRPAAATTAGGR